MSGPALSRYPTNACWMNKCTHDSGILSLRCPRMFWYLLFDLPADGWKRELEGFLYSFWIEATLLSAACKVLHDLAPASFFCLISPPPSAVFFSTCRGFPFFPRPRILWESDGSYRPSSLMYRHIHIQTSPVHGSPR